MDILSLTRRLQMHPGQDTAAQDGDAHAAVAVVLRPSACISGYEVLLIRRAERASDPWSGHMALPGGRLDPADCDLRAAAVREVAEEVGIDLVASARPVGCLSQVASPPMRTRVVVSPFVWVLNHDVPLCLAPDEIASAHWFSMDRWLSAEGRGSFDYRFQGRDMRLPRADLDGCRVWGITLRIIDDLLEQIRGAD
jgi:8-oxo-dGTP pyrophosphatase MutT (NUDIX family)